jgi:CheY-like chemotaxis protein
MDVQMPGMDGFETTAAIRQKETATRTRIPIIAMTAHAMAGDRERCLQAGMDAYVAKPVNSRELFEVIDRVTAVKAKKGSRSARTPAPGSALDEAALLERFKGDARLAAKLARLFLDDQPRLMTNIEQAVARRDPAKLARAAHALKGAVSNFAAPRAAAAAGKLEALAWAGNVDDAQKALAALRVEVSGVTRKLAALQKKFSSRGRARRKAKPKTK